MARWARSRHPDLFADIESQAERPVEPVLPQTSAPLTHTAAPQRAQRAMPVWLCLYFPSLPLQAVQDQCAVDVPCVVTDSNQTRLIVATNRAAHDKGIFPGHTLKNALALYASLQVVERQPSREVALLETLAQRFLAFTSRVSLQPPQSVLLEVRGSLRLFGGIEALSEQLLGRLRDDGYHFRHSVAPTAIGAYWLAQAGVCPVPQQVVMASVSAASFLQALNALDIGVTQWPPAVCSALQEMGVQTIADCRRLPRAGLTRRFGVGVLQSLAQAFGELPEVRKSILPPKRFEALWSLDAEISDAPQLLAGCSQLLQQLEQFLRQHQGATRRLQFDFYGWRGQSGTVSVMLSMASYQQQQWQRLLTERLERCALTQPAVSIGLTAEVSEALQVHSGALDVSNGEQRAAMMVDQQALHDLLDRLSARLGEHSVKVLQHVGEHRPEYASRLVSPSVQTTACVFSPDHLPANWQLCNVALSERQVLEYRQLQLQRPLWLLQTPQRLLSVDGVVHYQGALALLHGPERIASGWWDAQAVARDYFIAENPAAIRLWIFRAQAADTKQMHWWLHGFFG